MAGIDGYTKLLLHCNGVDESVTFVDSEITPKTITPNGTVQIDTDITDAFGGTGGCALFDGDSDYLTVPDSDDWNFGTGDFTIDCRIKFNAENTYGQIIGQCLDGNNFWTLHHRSANHSFYFYSYIGGAEVNMMVTSPITVDTDWHHLALVRYGNDFNIHYDGLSIGSINNTNAMPDITGGLEIGTWIAFGSQSYFNGWLDEIRVSKGIARWTSDFTPPTEEYSEVIYTSDILIDGTASADSEYSETYSADKGCDDNETTFWNSDISSFPHWWMYDLGEGITKKVQKLRTKTFHNSYGAYLKDFKLQGSNDNSGWVDIYTGQQANNGDWQDFIFINNISYRYHRIWVTSNWREDNDYACFYEVEMMEAAIIYTSDILIGGIASASLETTPASYACDNDEGSHWRAHSSAPQWWKYDLGAGNKKCVRKLRIKTTSDHTEGIGNFKLQGSNNDSDWTDIYTGYHGIYGAWIDFVFDNSALYRYYRVYIIDYTGSDPNCVDVDEIEMMEEEEVSENIVIIEEETITLSEEIIATEICILQEITGLETISLSEEIITTEINILQETPEEIISLSEEIIATEICILQEITGLETISLSEEVILSLINLLKQYKFLTDFRTKLLKNKIFSTIFHTVKRSFYKYDTDFRTKGIVNYKYKTDFRTVKKITGYKYPYLPPPAEPLTLPPGKGYYDYLAPGKLTDIKVYIDGDKDTGTELDDVDYSSLNINFNLNSTPSQATFILARHHDDFNHKLDDSESIIDEENKITIYDGNKKLVTLYITKIDGNSETDTVSVTAEDIRYKINKKSIQLYYGAYHNTFDLITVPTEFKDGEVWIDNNHLKILVYQVGWVDKGIIYSNTRDAIIAIFGEIDDLISGYDNPDFGFIPEPTESYDNCGNLINTLVNNSANINWYVDENERIRFQKVNNGIKKILSLSSLDKQRHIYDTITDDINLNRKTDNYYQSFKVQLGKRHSNSYVMKWMGSIDYNVDIEYDNEGKLQIIVPEKTEQDIAEVIKTWSLEWRNLSEQQWFIGQIKDNGLNEYYVGDKVIFEEDLLFGKESDYPHIKVHFRTQALLWNVTEDIIPVIIGSGEPQKNIFLTGYGIESPASKYEIVKIIDKNYLYMTINERYNYTDYALDLANFELSQNNKLLTEATVTLLLDSFEYYNISFQDLINLGNTIENNIYKDNNGFPLNISSYSFNLANRTVTLHLTNYGKSYYQRIGQYNNNYQPPRRFDNGFEEYVSSK